MTQIAWQPRLFDAGAKPRFDATFATRVRTPLDATSWIELVPGWLANPDALFAELLDALPWEQRERYMYTGMVTEPRLTAELDGFADAPTPLLAEAAQILSTHYGVRYDGLWCNLYRDGRDSTAWHGDRISCQREDCIVPVLTLGSSRRFLVKPREGGPSLVLRPQAGDLVVMGGRCQRDFVHSVPKTAEPCGARISLNFMSREQGFGRERRTRRALGV